MHAQKGLGLKFNANGNIVQMFDCRICWRNMRTKHCNDI